MEETRPGTTRQIDFQEINESLTSVIDPVDIIETANDHSKHRFENDTPIGSIGNGGADFNRNADENGEKTEKRID